MQFAITATLIRCAVISILLTAGAVACTQETPPESTVGMAVDDCRRLWRYTVWVETRLEAERAADDESLRAAAAAQVSEQYGVPLEVFYTCWDTLTDAGYSPRDLEPNAQ